VIGRARRDLPADIYPDDPWVLREERWAPDFSAVTETLFALSNGNLGIRGAIEDVAAARAPGTFLNGFHETWRIEYPEAAYGFATTGQTIVNLPEASGISITVDGELLTMAGGRNSHRSLDFRVGVLERTSNWTTRSGVGVAVRYRRLVSLIQADLAGFHVEVEVDRPATVIVASTVMEHRPPGASDVFDPRQGARVGHRVLEPVNRSREGDTFIATWSTANSRLPLTVAASHQIEGPDAVRQHIDTDDTFGTATTATVVPGTPLRITKWVVYRSDETVGEARSSLTAASAAGFDEMESAQSRALAAFWSVADIEVEEAGPGVQRAIRWTLFQLYQSSVHLAGRSIPAKGLTGQAYDGHYFWDTEVYLIPFLAAVAPDAAREVLRYRHGLLDHARARAKDLSVAGALFPWRTISGEEASAYFPAGTAQYHIDADIIHGLRHYLLATGDDETLWAIGVEMAVETARMWADLGFYRDGSFHIHGVTGPDEYSALVDDNAFTNRMARMNLRFAVDSVARMRAEQPDRFSILAAGLGLGPDEPPAWSRAAAAMFVPHNPDLDITPQDAHFLAKEPWDFAGVPPESYPLLLNFHPLVIYRHQVLKQADVVLADFLLGDEVSPDLKRRNFEFYDPITTGDSSLSPSIQSIAACEIGDMDRALTHFSNALMVDLADLAGNTEDGVHMASAGGIWLALTAGFGGFAIRRGGIVLTPRLPRGWTRLAYRTRFRGILLEVDLRPRRLDLLARGGDLEIEVYDRHFLLTDMVPVAVDL
jgi:alpha,alpha-trehalose phosphorylase